MNPWFLIAVFIVSIAVGAAVAHQKKRRARPPTEKN